MATVSRSVLVNGQHTSRVEFLQVLVKSLEALLDYEGHEFSDALNVRVNVRDGEPVSASVGRED